MASYLIRLDLEGARGCSLRSNSSQSD